MFEFVVLIEIEIEIEIEIIMSFKNNQEPIYQKNGHYLITDHDDDPENRGL